MNSNITTRLMKVLIAASLLALSGAVAADEAYWVALLADVSMNRTSIVNSGPSDKSVWILRNYDRQITLGISPKTGKEMYPHRSVQIQYVVNCVQNKLNIVSWKMFNEANAEGELVWAAKAPQSDANYRDSPSTEEEKAVTANVCGSNVGSR